MFTLGHMWVSDPWFCMSFGGQSFMLFSLLLPLLFLPGNVSLGFPGGACGKEPGCQCRRPERCGFNPGGGWWATVHRVAKSWTQLKGLSRTLDSRLQFSLCEHAIHLFTLFIY